MGHKATDQSKDGKSKLFVYGVLVFQIALIISLIKGLQLSLKSSERIVELKETKNEIEKDNQELLNKVKYVTSDYYVEKVAREDLQRAKVGETVVILPEKNNMTIGEPEITQRDDSDVANWQKWLNLLVK